METNKSRLAQAALWFMPTGVEVSVYLFLCFLTAVVSNLSFVKNFLYVSEGFNPFASAVGSIDQLLTQVVGEKIAGSLSLAIFWGLVGIVINVLWVVVANFSTELNNDLVYSSYVHPKNTDPKGPLYEFIVKTSLRVSVTIIFLFYLNFALRTALPAISSSYARVIQNWPKEKHLLSFASALIFEVLVFHTFVVLSRLITLRKQVFNG